MAGVNPAGVVFREPLFEAGRSAGVDLTRMGEGLQNVNVMEGIHEVCSIRTSPPSLAKAELRRAAIANAGRRSTVSQVICEGGPASRSAQREGWSQLSDLD